MRALDLLRLPSPGFPETCLTGHPVLDAFLRRIDAGLVGSKAVRRDVLVEVADHLLTSMDHSSDQPGPEDQAAKAAIERFGDPRKVGEGQRRERGRMFVLTTLVFGGVLGPLNYLLRTLPDFENGPGSALFSTISTALLMGYFFAFAIGTPRPSARQGNGSPEESGYEVSHSWGWKLAGTWLLLVATMAAIFSGMDVLGVGPHSEFPFAAGLAMLVMSAFAMTLPWSVFNRITVSEGRIVYATPFRQTEITLDGVLSVRQSRLAGTFFRLPPGEKIRVDWRDPDGELRTLWMNVDPQMRNGQRLIADLEQEADEGRRSPAPSST